MRAALPPRAARSGAARLRWLLPVIVLLGCNPREPVPVTLATVPLVDARRLAGQPRSVVDAALGARISGSAGDRDVMYRSGVHVQYRDGRAARFQAASLGQFRFGPEVLLLFGIQHPPPPTERTPTMLRWDAFAIPPFRNVIIHTHPRLRGGTDYVNLFTAAVPEDSVF